MSISLPFKDPVLIFALVLFIILLTPIALKKIKIPGIVGLILAGVFIGPNGFNLLSRDASFELFGNVGLLYIMFLAGLELDISEFNKKRNRSIIFGILTFIIPFSLGLPVSFYILHFSLTSAVLLSIMFSTQTLVAYPIASRLGITKNEAVAIAVGGTIITDTIVLLVLSAVSASTKGQLNADFWVRMIISFSLLLTFILWGFPKIARWFFKKIEGEKVSQFLFVLALVFLAAFASQLAGLEAIIGAFLAGLALNRLIPSSSALMNRLEFVGNSIFIPFFLLNVGMIVNLKILFVESQGLEVAGILLVVAFFSKWLAAYISQKLFKYTAIQRNVIFGLSSSHAAAALAVILIGFKLGLLNANILNGTILLILVSCLVASFITENAGRKLAIFESEEIPVISEQPERILVPVSNPEYIERLMDLAILLKEHNSSEPVYTLAVVDDDKDARDKLLISKKMLDKIIIHASATETKAEALTRIDINVSSGIIHTVKEKAISDIIIGWTEKISTMDYIFGSLLENLLDNCYKSLYVTKLIQPLNTTKNIIVAVVPNAEFEIGFKHWVNKLKLLSGQIGSKIIFYADYKTIDYIKSLLSDSTLVTEPKFIDFDKWDDFQFLTKDVTIDDLFIIISARLGTISYNNNFDAILKLLNKHVPYTNSIIIYPEQLIQTFGEMDMKLEGFTKAPLQGNIDRISKLTKTVKKLLKNK